MYSWVYGGGYLTFDPTDLEELKCTNLKKLALNLVQSCRLNPKDKVFDFQRFSRLQTLQLYMSEIVQDIALPDSIHKLVLAGPRIKFFFSFSNFFFLIFIIIIIIIIII